MTHESDVTSEMAAFRTRFDAVVAQRDEALAEIDRLLKERDGLWAELRLADKLLAGHPEWDSK